MKRCFKCGEVKGLSDFYKHNGMADGHLNKCKECCRNYSSAHRQENIDSIRKYDRLRGNRQPKGYAKEYRERFPIKYKAHNIVNNAIRDGKLFPMPCEICGNRAVAHHDDYAKPLNVRWLCQAHHKQWHSDNGEGKNG